MPVTTRLQARSGQPPDLVSSPGANHPRRSCGTQQGNAGTIRNLEVGTPSTDMVYENCITDQYLVSPCGASRCKTCPYLITSCTYESNVTNRSYNVINHSDENLSCKSQNVIYLLSCLRCNMQYVGETVIPLNKRINIHRTSKVGCDHMIDHFSDTCPNDMFSIIQIIEGKWL